MIGLIGRQSVLISRFIRDSLVDIQRPVFWSRAATLERRRKRHAFLSRSGFNHEVDAPIFRNHFVWIGGLCAALCRNRWWRPGEFNSHRKCRFGFFEITGEPLHPWQGDPAEQCNLFRGRSRPGDNPVAAVQNPDLGTIVE